jgi:hypothetical protein
VSSWPERAEPITVMDVESRRTTRIATRVRSEKAGSNFTPRLVVSARIAIGPARINLAPTNTAVVFARAAFGQHVAVRYRTHTPSGHVRELRFSTA